MSSASASGGRRSGATMALAAIVTVVAVLAAIAGVIYLTKSAAAIPSFLPGKEVGKTNAHHTRRGIALLVVAVALFVVAGISLARSGKSKSS